MSRRAISALAITFLCVFFSAVRDTSAAKVPEAPGTCTVPKAFGTLKLSVMAGLAFEAPDGTIRVVDVRKECSVELTITRK